MQVNNRKLAEGFYRGRRRRATRPPCCAPSTSSTRSGPTASATCSSADAGLSTAAADAVPRAGRDPYARHLVRRPRPGARRRADPLLDEGLAELAAVVEGARSGRARAARRRPADRARPRLLHGHGLRDADGRARGPRLDLLGRPLRLAGLRRAYDVPRGRHLDRACPGSWAGCSAAGWSQASPVGTHLRAGRRGRRGRRGRLRRGRHGAAGARHRRPRSRRRPPSSASRSGTPTAAASRTCGSPATASRASRTSAPASRSPPTRRTWQPPDEDLPPARSSSTDPHEGAEPRDPHATTPARLRADDAGPTVTLAGWVARRRDHGGVAFLDLRDVSGVVQVVVRDRRSPTGCATSTACGSSARSAPRPEGNDNPDLPTGEVEVVATARRRAQRVGAAAVPDRRPRRGRRGGAAALPLPRPAPPGAGAGRCGCARDVNRFARDVLLGARLRRDRDADADPVDARGRPRLPRARCGCSPATGTRCRSRRSCSSSC